MAVVVVVVVFSNFLCAGYDSFWVCCGIKGSQGASGRVDFWLVPPLMASHGTLHISTLNAIALEIEHAKLTNTYKILSPFSFRVISQWRFAAFALSVKAGWMGRGS